MVHRSALISDYMAPPAEAARQDHEHGASLSCGVPVYSPVYAGTITLLVDKTISV